MAKKELSVTREKIDSIAVKLKSLPELPREKEAVSMQDAIKALAPTIAGLQKKGYSLVDIAKHLSDDGLKIAPLTLKNYLRRTKTRQKPKSKKPAQYTNQLEGLPL